MRRALHLLGLGLATLAVACVGDDSTGPFPSAPTDAGADHTVVAADASAADGTAPPGDDGATKDGDAPDATPLTVAVVRFANWAADAPPVDFCLAKGTAPFTGPVLAANAPPDAGVAALAFPAVSAYLELPPGKYAARIVPAGADDCQTGIGDDAPLPDLAAGTFATIALVGDAHPIVGTPGLAIHGYVDDARVASGVALRFIHAAPSTAAVDVGAESTATFKPWFQSVAFAASGAALDGGAPDGAPSIDSHGYAALKPLAQATIGIRSHDAPDGSTDLLVAGNVSVAGGAMLTLALLDGASVPSDGGPVASTQLLACVDNAGVVGLLASCTVLAP
jgi:hypothetical protein